MKQNHAGWVAAALGFLASAALGLAIYTLVLLPAIAENAQLFESGLPIDSSQNDSKTMQKSIKFTKFYIFQKQTNAADVKTHTIICPFFRNDRTKFRALLPSYIRLRQNTSQ